MIKLILFFTLIPSLLYCLGQVYSDSSTSLILGGSITIDYKNFFKNGKLFKSGFSLYEISSQFLTSGGRNSAAVFCVKLKDPINETYIDKAYFDIGSLPINGHFIAGINRFESVASMEYCNRITRTYSLMNYLFIDLDNDGAADKTEYLLYRNDIGAEYQVFLNPRFWGMKFGLGVFNGNNSFSDDNNFEKMVSGIIKFTVSNFLSIAFTGYGKNIDNKVLEKINSNLILIFFKGKLEIQSECSYADLRKKNSGNLFDKTIGGYIWGKIGISGFFDTLVRYEIIKYKKISQAVCVSLMFKMDNISIIIEDKIEGKADRYLNSELYLSTVFKF